MPPSNLAAVPFDAPAVERGVGLFETVLLRGRQKFLWERHIERLRGALVRLELPAPGREEIEAAAGAAMAEIPEGRTAEAALRLTWIAVAAALDDRASWRLDASVRPIPGATLRRRAGSRAISLPAELGRDTPSLKSTSYLAAVLGLRYAARRGGDEGLFVAPGGSYLEGTASAIVAWDGGRLLQSGHAVLPSVTAAVFMGEAPRCGDLSRTLLQKGAILLGALTTAAPLVTLDGEPCLLPPPMLERISTFNRQLLEGTLR